MKGFSRPAWLSNFGLFALRLVLGAIFIYAGWMKLGNIEVATGGFSSMGFPVPEFFAYFVGIVELLGGLMLVFGFYTMDAALLLTIVIVVAILVAHLKGGWQGLQFPLSILGGLLGLMGAGPGKWKITKKDCVMEK